MCTVCGCSEGEAKVEGQAIRPYQAHSHALIQGKFPHTHAAHEHTHTHSEQDTHDYGQGAARAHAPGMTQARMVQIEQDILGKNNQYAQQNRQYFASKAILALNLVSSPGSGKTTLLTETLQRLHGKLPLAVIEGDQQTNHDAERIRATGVPALQNNTGKGCHVDAHMVGHALESLSLANGGLLFIENVGNLVCPAAFDLGEAHKVVILSVTEGEDKPLKYPDMFHAADIMLLHKVDLLPYLKFDVQQCEDYARRVNPNIKILHVSATSGEGMETWLAWLMQQRSGLVAQHLNALEQQVQALRNSLQL